MTWVSGPGRSGGLGGRSRLTGTMPPAETAGTMFRVFARSGEAVMCFVHTDSVPWRAALLQQVSVGSATVESIAGVGATLRSAGEGIPARGVGKPEVVARPDGQTIDGFSKVLHNRWNRDLPSVAKARQGEAVQFLCRDALDRGAAARTLTPEGVLKPSNSATSTRSQGPWRLRARRRETF
jgi:hypothetical protein